MVLRAGKPDLRLREHPSRRVPITQISPDFLRVLKQMLGLDETATDGDILMAVQQIVEPPAKDDQINKFDVAATKTPPEEHLALVGEDESRVEQIRARVRELNAQYGHEITPMAMFDLIMGEFKRESSRRD